MKILFICLFNILIVSPVFANINTDAVVSDIKEMHNLIKDNIYEEINPSIKSEKEGVMQVLSAIKNKKFDVAKLLINNWVDINDVVKSAPKFDLQNDMDAIKFFVKNNADINVKTDDGLGSTLLMLTDDTEIADYLLKNGATMYVLDDMSRTALSRACLSVNPDKVQLLLNYAVKSFDIENLSLYLYQVAVHHPENADIKDIIKVMEILFTNDYIYDNQFFLGYINAIMNFSYGKDEYEKIFNFVYGKKHEYLFRCISKKDVNKVFILLEREGVDPNWELDGETPLSLAKKKGNKEIYNLLIAYGALK